MTVSTPEHEKLKAVAEKSQAIGEFLDWLINEKGVVLAQRRDKYQLWPAGESIESWLAIYFEIDPQALEAEKVAMLEEMRAASLTSVPGGEAPAGKDASGGRLAEVEALAKDANTARPIAEWHEDIGPVLWWRREMEEPPYVGTPLDNEWPCKDPMEPEESAWFPFWTPMPSLPAFPSVAGEMPGGEA